jgi:PEP-CTERM motif
MQLRRFLQLTTSVLVLVGCSFANSMNDPKVVIGGTGAPLLETVTVSGNTFSFVSPSGTSPGTSPCIVNSQTDTDCSIINGNDFTWSSLTFLITPTQGNLSCDGGSFFAHCTVNNKLGIITFSSGCVEDFCTSGIGPGGSFAMSVEGFLAGTGFGVTANGVPEPASLVLMMTGALVFLRRRRK